MTEPGPAHWRAAGQRGPVPGLTTGLTGRLRAAGLDPVAVAAVAAAALAEDLAGGTDVTTAATVPLPSAGRGDLVARTPGVVAGLPVAEAVFAVASAELACAALAADGDRVAPGQPVLTRYRPGPGRS